jgi:hypothetical protein
MTLQRGLKVGTGLHATLAHQLTNLNDYTQACSVCSHVRHLHKDLMTRRFDTELPGVELS